MCFSLYGHHRYLIGLTHSFPTRRSSDLHEVPIGADRSGKNRVRIGDQLAALDKRVPHDVGKQLAGVVLLAEIAVLRQPPEADRDEGALVRDRSLGWLFSISRNLVVPARCEPSRKTGGFAVCSLMERLNRKRLV